MNSNRSIYNADFTQFLPEPLKKDETIKGLAAAMSAKMLEVSGIMNTVLIYSRIDELKEDVLDVLAYDMHVDWYNEEYPIEAKRDIIKHSVQVHKRMGTKYAIEKALGALYPESEVEEWFQYGGEPFHFRIVCDVTKGRIEASWAELVRAVKMYKRLSAHMEEVTYQSHIHCVIGTHTDFWLYKVPYAGQIEAGTYPQRNTRGAQSGENCIVETGANVFPYTMPIVGTKPERAIIFDSNNAEFDINTTLESYQYTVNATGQNNAGEEPQRNTVGASEHGSVSNTVSATGYNYTVKLCGSTNTL